MNMRKTTSMKKNQSDHTVTFICEWCGKTKGFTQEEIAKQKKFDPDIKSEGFDYYIPCPFCKDGYMFPKEEVVFRELATDLFGD